MIRLVFSISLTVQGPLLSKSSTPGDFGLDAVMARNHQGQPIINGSHIAGKLRDAWEDLGFNYGDTFLGKQNDAGDYAPSPKRFQFSDFTLGDTAPAVSGVRHRIRIDDSRKAVQKGAICFAENLFQSGGSFTFTGRCNCIAHNDQDKEDLHSAIKAGLRFIPQLGGERTIGLGRLQRVDISLEKHPFLPPESKYEFEDGLGLIIKPLDSFCFAQRRVASNLFESSSFIPGAAIAGAVASMWRQMLGGKSGAISESFDPHRSELGKYFDDLRFLNALPGKAENRRPVQWPHSLVKDIDKKVWDVARFADPVLINRNAPAFFVDWKDNSDVNEDFGWASPARELRVRTAIDRNNRRALDNELFAYEMIVPGDQSWYSRVSLPEEVAVDERKKVADQLASLLQHGLTGLGKTKAGADVKIVKFSDIGDSHLSTELDPDSCNSTWFLTLQTPAIICDPKELKESTVENLHAAYAVAWQQLSGGCLTLSHYFAGQFLAGGKYLWRRFQGAKDYYPWLLTEAGSVFILKAVAGKENEAIDFIRRCCRQGLDIPDWAVKNYTNNKSKHDGNHWTTCPFLPQLGYGECRVNLQVHTDPDKKLTNANISPVERVEDLIKKEGAV